MIGSFPDFFGAATDAIYARDNTGPRPGEPWESDESDEDADTATVSSADPAPAPWATGRDPWLVDGENDSTTTIDVTRDARDLLDPDTVELAPNWAAVDWLFLREESKALGQLTADAIAVYRPWHLHGENWGIYVSAEAVTTFTGGLSRLTGAPLAQLAPLALRQVLEHEWIHFAFEVAGTEVEDVLRELVYPDYVLRRFGTPFAMWSAGPLEEIVASWAEVEFAKRPPTGFAKLRPRNYRRAVERLLALAPAGYRDWHWMQDWDAATEIIATVMSLIADRQMRTFRWTDIHPREKAQVPVYWLGNPANAAAFGGFPKSAGPPSIKRFEKWLRSVIRAREVSGRGKGSHKQWELPNGKDVRFATSAGFLLPPEAKEIAAAVGLTRTELFEHIAAMRQPQALA